MTSAVVVGSGPNGLAAALTLATAGVSVRVIEAAGSPGGGTRSAELTLPGLLHDECSAFHPLAVDTPFSRAAGLDAHGLEWCWPEIQYAHPLESGDGASAWRSATDTAADLGRDGPAWQAVFGELADRLDRISEDLFEPMLSLPHHPLDLALFGSLSALPASLLARRWRGPRAQAHGVHPVYAYAHVPSGWPGDATALVEAQIERFAPGFGERVLARHVRDVAAMSSYNANYVGGDIVTGANTPRQLVARPRAALDPYWLGTGLLYLCSAATPPGGGAHGMCGYNAAHSALRRLTRRG
ncbi:hypothetical protein NSZ01_10730 [Nocardioides szechwanensis]|uniref:NAD(P)-binding Rossmann-like domain-containing protein n=1 Tax=Nocardioides szechwanensis TaxID=1005944 RepID=A0A1H0CWU2_9ACTN|nr:FAD-dependent oxidoreductase [Nocardioides szechwanensis]GEP33305.1 hypothetical protein NSZ01_10730 [Nocardioides szechwanensis]SDN62372.1 NAD(P)-binding Rossmann-like domain-containing protein [Nocardioides szechwanensis]